MIDSQLGPYRVVAKLGEGGMGEVYRARDTQLDRDVAIKILPEAFAHDADRLARFQREAKTLASLNHPNIAIIYGLEQSGDVHALVMELVEGEDLSQRIDRGAIPIDEALPLAKQIAEALEAAHEQGIIHRDLKPANIKVRADGMVKVLDFGLAKAIERAGESGEAGGPGGVAGAYRPGLPDLSASPTLTSPAQMTGVGVILGTAAYMAPEQARGKVVDKRSDIWAFGCVLYEMLTGHRTFEGETVSDVLASVIAREPRWDRLADTPPGVVSVVRRCLEKDPRNRLRDIGDARYELQGGRESLEKAIVAPRSFKTWPRIVPWAVTALALAVAGVALLRSVPAPTTSHRLIQVDAHIGGDASLFADQGPAAVLSPDGSVLAFVAQRPGQARRLFVRRLDQLAATELLGTEDVYAPFFSPDGQSLAFFAAGKLKKVSASGGGVIVVCDARNGRGGSWGEDGSIYFTPGNSVGESGLYRVSAAGGTPTPLTPSDGNEGTQRWPQVLPGGRALLYTASTNISNFSDGQVVVQSLPNGPKKTLVKGAIFGRFLRSGHLVFVRDGRLFGVPFDIERLEMIGAAVPVLESVSGNLSTGVAQFDASNNGVVVYLPAAANSGLQLQWLSRDGTIRPTNLSPRDWSNPRVSPDGQQVAMDVFDGKQTDIWIYEWVRDVMTRLTFDAAEKWQPVWTPEGSRITFRWTSSESPSRLLWQRADGSTAAERLTNRLGPEAPSSWHPTGRTLAFVATHAGTDVDIMMLPLEGGPATPSPGTPTAFLQTPYAEYSPAFSPDGRWIAYVSNEGGHNGVYVRPYPGPGGQRLIAPEGTDPTWSRSRSELVFVGPDQRLMISAYHAVGNTFQVESPRPWSSARAVPRPRGHFNRPGRSFDLHPDGDRAIGSWIPDTQTASSQDSLVLVFNLFDELNRLAPVKQ